MSDDLNTFNQLAKYLIDSSKKMGVSKYIEAEKVLTNFNIELNENEISDKKLVEYLKKIISYTPKTSTNLFFNQLFGGIDSKAMLGDLLAVILNNSMSTYKIAGPMILIEKEIIKNVCKIINYPSNSGGTIPTGGSMSNFMSMVLARDKKIKSIKHKGISDKLICYTSDNSHYSISKNASFTGIGKDNVRYINTNHFGEMITKDLEIAIKKDIKNGHVPFLINATMGTTVMGAIDPLNDISSICQKYSLWMHVDGAYGGATIFSKKYNNLNKGIEKSDSFCFNAHKTLGAPLSSSIFVVREKNHLHYSFQNEAEYLYQTDSDEYNLGKSSFECGRRNNSLKFWTLWKSIGTEGLSYKIDHNYYLANIAYDYVKNNTNYTLFSKKNSLSICFNYKDYDPIQICTNLYKNNILMVGYGECNGNVFIRMVCVNRENDKEDILNFFKYLENFADNKN
ncbi:MAG: cysteine synthase [Flavobacteriales bacterium]|nr:cysteine synthase [Flavobacteriales bacterium]